MSVYGFCPECDSEVRVNKPRIGQQVTCRSCAEDLEVIGLRPLELDYAISYDDDAGDDEFEDNGYEVFAVDDNWS